MEQNQILFPDIIIVNHAWNEMYYFDDSKKVQSWRTLSDGSWGFHSVPQKITSYKPYWFDHLLKYSQLLTKIRLKFSDKVDGEIGIEKSLSSKFDQNALEIYRTNLQLFRQAALIFNAKLFVIKQPTLITESISKSDKDRCRYEWHGFNHEAHVIAFKKIYEIIDEEIEANNIIDLTKLSGISTNFYDHIHPTEDGASNIAEIVAKSLEMHLKN